MRVRDKFLEGDEPDEQPEEPPERKRCSPAPKAAGTGGAPARVKLRLSKAEMARRTAAMTEMRKLGANGPGGEVNGFSADRLKVDVILRKEDRDAYESLIAEPATNRAQALAWLKERGYRIGVDAVSRHKSRFLESLAGVREAARLADQLAKLSDKHGGSPYTDVSVTRVQQILTQKLYKVCGDDRQPGEEGKEQIEVEELAKMTKAVKEAVDARKHVEAMRAEFKETNRRAAAEAASAAKAGASGAEVADRVRELLGIPLGDVDDPGDA